MSQRIFKISLLGEGAVGKTSIRRTYLGESFKEGYMMTIGADFAVKKMVHKNVEDFLLFEKFTIAEQLELYCVLIFLVLKLTLFFQIGFTNLSAITRIALFL